MRHLRVQSALRWAFAATLLLTPALPTHAQGCAQCLDSTRANPPQVQSAYRHAIYLLGGVGILLFLITGVIIRQQR